MYHDALSSGVVRDEILKRAKKHQETLPLTQPNTQTAVATVSNTQTNTSNSNSNSNVISNSYDMNIIDKLQQHIMKQEEIMEKLIHNTAIKNTYNNNNNQNNSNSNSNAIVNETTSLLSGQTTTVTNNINATDNSSHKKYGSIVDYELAAKAIPTPIVSHTNVTNATNANKVSNECFVDSSY